MKKLLILSILLAQSSFAQMISLSLGNKTAEIGISQTLESEIILGGSFALTDSKLLESKVNLLDRGSYLHRMSSNYTPTVFALMGANFDNLNIITKIGASYINQDVCKINSSKETSGIFVRDDKKLYLAMGAMVTYQISEVFGVNCSFDNVSSIMLGINYKLR